MPIYQFEAMDGTGQEIRDVIEAANQDEAQATIRQKAENRTAPSVVPSQADTWTRRSKLRSSSVRNGCIEIRATFGSG